MGGERGVWGAGRKGRGIVAALVVGGLLGVAGMAQGQEMRAVEVRVEAGSKVFVGTLVWDGTSEEKRPGVLMVPNWMGPTAQSREKAWRVAARGYVVLLWDMYGEDVRPTNAGEAAKAAGALRAGDRQTMRERAQLGLATLAAQADKAPLAKGKLAAIGFCFGGGAVLELARSGADVAAVVSLHGNLDTPRPASAETLRAKVLVLHGADDPVVPPEQIAAFEQEMRAAKADWQLISFGGAVHSFTNPYADRPGQSAFHPDASRRAFAYMDLLLAEAFAAE